MLKITTAPVISVVLQNNQVALIHFCSNQTNSNALEIHVTLIWFNRPIGYNKLSGWRWLYFLYLCSRLSQYWSKLSRVDSIICYDRSSFSSSSNFRYPWMITPFVTIIVVNQTFFIVKLATVFNERSSWFSAVIFMDT